MPDAMMNGGFAPYLAQAFTPQGIAGGVFGSGMGNVPGNIFSSPTFAQSYGVPPFLATPQLGQPSVQPYTGWQQQMPQFQSGGVGWPYGQVQPWQNIGQNWSPQLGQSFSQPYTGWQLLTPQLGALGQGQPLQNVSQEPLILAQLLRQYAVPISAVIASPYGQPYIAQHLMQTADMLARLLPLVGVPQLIPVAHLLAQCAGPISAVIASPYGQAQIAQNIVQTAELLSRVLPLVGTQQMGQSYAQPNIGWQQQMVPQLPVANLLGQQWHTTQQPTFGQLGGQFGQGQFGIAPFLAQQGLGGQLYGTARA
jgi:hypothetical protein